MKSNKTLKYITKDDIIMEPNDVLKEKSIKVALPLTKEDSQVLRMLYKHVSDSQNDEFALKHNIRPAVGIAAIQIGYQKRLLAIKTTDEQGNIHKYMLANPEYVYKSKEMIYLSNGEGCLSVEEGKYDGIVPRHETIIVAAYNLFTDKVEKIELSNYIAIVLQHEMDHLDGVLYIDKINKLNPNFVNDEWRAI